MKEHPNYSKAPITEALIDFRVELPENARMESLAEIEARLAPKYQRAGKMFVTAARFEFQPNEEQVVSSGDVSHRGFRLQTPDEAGRRVAQISVDGFTFSRLRPYDRWESLRDEAREIWALYREALQPTAITRIAVRYINSIEIPVDPKAPEIRYEDYINLYPRIPDNFPYTLIAGYFMQVQIPQVDLQSMLIFNSTVGEQPTPTVLPVVLDFDLFREGRWTVDEEAWEFVELLRDRKNELFEASISMHTRRLIQ